MAVETGTANGHKELLDKIATFVTTNQDLINDNQQWEILQQTDTSYQFKAPGLSGKERIYCGLDIVSDVQKDYYNMRVYGARGFDDSQPLHTQPYTVRHVLLLWNNAIKYWLIANGQRLIIVAKISTNYELGYIGKIFLYATPGQYPYPVLISGTYVRDDRRWDITNGFHASIQCPGDGTATIYLSDGSSQKVCNMDGSERKNIEEDAFVSPTCEGSLSVPIVQKNTDDSYTMMPLVLCTPKDKGNILGELDGIYWVTGHDNASENIINVDEQQYLVVQNTFRTSWQDYCAVKLA